MTREGKGATEAREAWGSGEGVEEVGEKQQKKVCLKMQQ